MLNDIIDKNGNFRLMKKIIFSFKVFKYFRNKQNIRESGLILLQNNDPRKKKSFMLHWWQVYVPLMQKHPWWSLSNCSHIKSHTKQNFLLLEIWKSFLYWKIYYRKTESTKHEINLRVIKQSLCAHIDMWKNSSTGVAEVSMWWSRCAIANLLLIIWWNDSFLC